MSTSDNTKDSAFVRSARKLSAKECKERAITALGSSTKNFLEHCQWLNAWYEKIENESDSMRKQEIAVELNLCIREVQRRVFVGNKFHNLTGDHVVAFDPSHLKLLATMDYVGRTIIDRGKRLTCKQLENLRSELECEMPESHKPEVVMKFVESILIKQDEVELKDEKEKEKEKDKRKENPNGRLIERIVEKAKAAEEVFEDIEFLLKQLDEAAFKNGASLLQYVHSKSKLDLVAELKRVSKIADKTLESLKCLGYQGEYDYVEETERTGRVRSYLHS